MSASHKKRGRNSASTILQALKTNAIVSESRLLFEVDGAICTIFVQPLKFICGLTRFRAYDSHTDCCSVRPSGLSI